MYARLDVELKLLGNWRPGHPDYLSFGIDSQSYLEREIGLFRKTIARAFHLASERGQTTRQSNPLFWNLRNAFVRGDQRGLSGEVKYSFQSFVLRSRLPKAIIDQHLELADLRYPYEWYPATRMMQRTIHLHVGPTNSGKTYHALKALEAAKSGVYAGPLRLLAHEVYTRFMAKGKPCSLITGEEQRIPEDVDNYFSSCTVEMAPLNQRVDVAVIDEIQMIADDERGWAWTQAFLGIQAKELHLCGEERAVELIQDLCARIGDKCVVHRYERLNALHTMKESLNGDFRNLQKGDCVVSFTRVGLHKLKAGIEQQTGRRCAIVYGSLPPETRANQAALFNDPDNDYDFLVASDAIGMGLNLEIRRVVFEAATKFDGMTHRELTVSEIKQIGGRAGRYKTASSLASAKESQTRSVSSAAASPASVRKGWALPGYVTALDEEDLSLIDSSFKTDVKPIKTAGMKPPNFVIERFASYFPPQTPLNFILSRLREMCRLSDRFHLCNFTDAIGISEAIQEYPLSISDRCQFVNCPVSLNDPRNVLALKGMAECVANMKSGALLDIAEIDIEMLQLTQKLLGVTAQEYLGRLESLHRSITLYLWLSYRFEGVFQSQHLAFHVKELVEEKIANHLAQLNFVSEDMQKRREKARNLAKQQQQVLSELVEEEVVVAEQAHSEGPGMWKEEGHGEPLLDDLLDIPELPATDAAAIGTTAAKESAQG